MIETSAQRAGVIGWPIAHSRSPTIHQYWLKELGIPGSYERFAVRPEEFRKFVDEIGKDGFLGANVTAPHKEAAFDACERRTKVAEALGAVNTLWRQDDHLWGDNTDVSGFLANLDEAAPGWAEQKRLAVVIGAGGAARAIVYALISRGFERVAVVNRTKARAEALAAHFTKSTAAILGRSGQRIAGGRPARQRQLAWHGRTSAPVHRSRPPAGTGRCHGRRLYSFADTAHRSCAGAGTTRRGGARHAAPSSCARLRALVRQAPSCDASASSLVEAEIIGDV